MDDDSQLKSRWGQKFGKTEGNIRRSCALVFRTTMIMCCLAVLTSLAGEQTPEEAIDRIVAIVNNDIILLSEEERALAPYIENIKKRRLPEQTEEMMLSMARKDIRDNLIDEQLIIQKAAELRITASDEEINAALEQMKKSMLYSDETFIAFLSETGYTMDEYRQQIKSQILKNKLLRQEIKSRTVVTPEEINNYYQAHQEEFVTGTQYHLKHIIMQIPKGADSVGREAVREKMEEVHKRITDGDSFESLARQYSQSSFADAGGDLGLFPEDDLAPELKKTIINTEEGGITPVIETDFGYQIFYVQAVIKNDGGFNDNVSDKIYEKLYNEKLDEKFSAWIKQLHDSSHIKIME